MAAADIITVLNGTMIYETGTFMNGTPGGNLVDVVTAYNDFYDPDLSPTVTWTPTLFTIIDPIQRVIPLVQSGAGLFNW